MLEITLHKHQLRSEKLLNIFKISSPRSITHHTLGEPLIRLKSKLLPIFPHQNHSSNPFEKENSLSFKKLGKVQWKIKGITMSLIMISTRKKTKIKLKPFILFFSFFLSFFKRPKGTFVSLILLNNQTKGKKITKTKLEESNHHSMTLETWMAHVGNDRAFAGSLSWRDKVGNGN